MNCFQKMLEWHALCNFQSTEGARVGAASNSELRRWFKAGSVEINYELVKAEDPYPAFVKSVVLFPKNKKKRCTFYFDDSVTLIQFPDTISLIEKEQEYDISNYREKLEDDHAQVGCKFPQHR